jgi:hypothetical protein
MKSLQTKKMLEIIIKIIGRSSAFPGYLMIRAILKLFENNRSRVEKSQL